LENEVISRAATMVWKEVLDAFVRGALELEEERNWWDSVVNSHRGVVIYLIQSRSTTRWWSFCSSISSTAPTLQVDPTTQRIQPGFTPVIPLSISLGTVQTPPQRFCRAHFPDVAVQPHAPGDPLLSQVPHSH
jgi:hypothetical protein